MSAKKLKLTAKQARALFDYTPETGELIWKVRHGWKHPGHTAGTLNNDGYMQVTVHGEVYRLHRVVWLWVYGEWPVYEIDHIDRDKTNNRIANLRDVTHGVNVLNAPAYGESGIKGVSFQCGKFRARISDPSTQRTMCIGTYETPEEAAEAFCQKHQELHGINSPHFDTHHQPHPALIAYAAKYLEERSKTKA